MPHCKSPEWSSLTLSLAAEMAAPSDMSWYGICAAHQQRWVEAQRFHQRGSAFAPKRLSQNPNSAIVTWTSPVHSVRSHDQGCRVTGVQAATEQRWEEAERFFQIVLKEEPDSASAFSNMGNVHLSQRRPEQAVADFSRAIQLAPEVRSTGAGASQALTM